MVVRLTCAAAVVTALVSAAGAQQSSPAQRQSQTSGAQESALPERFTAVAVSAGGPRSAAGIERVDITIERWSTPGQTERLITVLKEKGEAALVEALTDMQPVGTIQTPGSLGYDLRYATEEPLPDGGRRIFIATNRPISYWEAVNRPRSIDYPFTYIELRVDAQGRGEGKLALATHIAVSRRGKVIELVNYASQPVQLNQVRHTG